MTPKTNNMHYANQLQTSADIMINKGGEEVFTVLAHIPRAVPLRSSVAPQRCRLSYDGGKVTK